MQAWRRHAQNTCDICPHRPRNESLRRCMRPTLPFPMYCMWVQSHLARVHAQHDTAFRAQGSPDLHRRRESGLGGARRRLGRVYPEKAHTYTVSEVWVAQSLPRRAPTPVAVGRTRSSKMLQRGSISTVARVCAQHVHRGEGCREGRVLRSPQKSRVIGPSLEHKICISNERALHST